MSSTILNTFDGQRYDGLMQFMHCVQAAGFTDEFDNSLVMRMIWNKLGELKRIVGFDESKIYFTTKTESNPLHGVVLVVTIHSPSKEDAKVSLVLFVRDVRIAVSSNVLTEEVKPIVGQNDVLAAGVYWFEAEKAFKVCPHFDKVALKAFRAVYKALAPKDDDIALRLQITATQLGWRVEYRMYGTKIMVTQFDFNK